MFFNNVPVSLEMSADQLVMWDNRCTMHRGLPFDDLRYKRDMRRTTARDSAPTCEQEGISLEQFAAE